MGRPKGAKNKRFAGRPKSQATISAERRERKRVRRRAKFEERKAWRQEAKAIRARDKWLSNGIIKGGKGSDRQKAINILAKGGNKTVIFDGRGKVEVEGKTFTITKDVGIALRGDDAQKYQEANRKEAEIQKKAQEKMDKKAAADEKKDLAHLERESKKRAAAAEKEAKKLTAEQKEYAKSQKAAFAKAVREQKARERAERSRLRRLANVRVRIPRGGGGGKKKGKSKKGKVYQGATDD